MSAAFSERAMREFERIRSRYPDPEAAILPSLYLWQQEHGSVSDEGILCIAELLGLSPARIEGVATFYTMYNRKPVGRYHIQVCRNLSCSLMGAEELIEVLAGKLGVKPGETTADGKFTLSTVECLGSCGTAPVMQVNEDYHENLTGDAIDAILEKCR